MTMALDAVMGADSTAKLNEKSEAEADRELVKPDREWKPGSPPMTREPPGSLAATKQWITDTRARARSAIRRMENAGRFINYVAVAWEARTLRAPLYRAPELRAE
ncbi:hypothetical protein [Arthrobacter oryzae]|uniref:Uncharacterized protein n=1 Tax=Arthrobacter oryzae TaxID=409290 RepID=A0A3N0BS30_9MICC|nr:hypothetical protein [Arthrobacter oryzae]RNL51792.1 hypothetical protein D7003_14950 [Arthrobacter oryzae]